jgi:hypothetical protein
MLSIGSGLAKGDFQSLRLKLKAQAIEPVYKILLEFPIIQYLPLFLDLLLLNTKN